MNFGLFFFIIKSQHFIQSSLTAPENRGLNVSNGYLHRPVYILANDKGVPMTTTFTPSILRLAISLWLGGVALFTFVLTPLIFRNESRDAAGRIVGYLFPGYFRWGLGCGLVALAALMLQGNRHRHFRVAWALLVAMTVATAVQTWYIEPKAAALKREIPSFEATPRDHPLRREFSRLHGISAVCNLAVCAGGVALVVLL